jgi:hypothetical protein
MISAVVALWGGLPKWAQDALKWIGVGIAVFFTGKVIAENLKAEGARKQRDETKVKQAQAKVAVGKRSNEIISEERTHADEAIAARDSSPLHPSSDLVPEHIGRVAFRDHGGGETR